MLRLMKMNELNEEKLRKKGYNLKRKIMNGLVNDGMCMQIMLSTRGIKGNSFKNGKKTNYN